MVGDGMLKVVMCEVLGVAFDVMYGMTTMDTSDHDGRSGCLHAQWLPAAARS